MPRELKVPQHQQALLPALCLALQFDIPVHNIKKSLVHFPGLAHRFEMIVNKEHIQIINDSAATTPQSVILALRAIKQTPIILIAGGGAHKKLNFKELFILFLVL